MDKVEFWQCKDKRFSKLELTQDAKLALPVIRVNNLDCLIPKAFLELCFDTFQEVMPTDFEEFELALRRKIEKLGFTENK